MKIDEFWEREGNRPRPIFQLKKDFTVKSFKGWRAGTNPWQDEKSETLFEGSQFVYTGANGGLRPSFAVLKGKRISRVRWYEIPISVLKFAGYWDVI